MAINIFEWDEEKRQANLAKHDVDFELVFEFDWEAATISEDRRFEYGETRYRAYGYIEGRLFVAAFTGRNGIYRIINLRKANEREKKIYGRQN